MRITVESSSTRVKPNCFICILACIETVLG
jgi:hypothetical protein